MDSWNINEERKHLKRCILQVKISYMWEKRKMLPTLLKLASGFDRHLNPASWMPFNLSFYPNQWLHLNALLVKLCTLQYASTNKRRTIIGTLQRKHSNREHELNLSTESICHQIKWAIRRYKRYCAIIFKTSQTHTPEYTHKWFRQKEFNSQERRSFSGVQ